jgi:hypothetical protein
LEFRLQAVHINPAAKRGTPNVSAPGCLRHCEFTTQLVLDKPFCPAQSQIHEKGPAVPALQDATQCWLGVHGCMIARFIYLALLLCCVTRAEGAPDLKRVHSSEDLARFISSMATNDAAFSVLLDGLDSTNSITVTPYTSTIPIREIYGTVVETRFRDILGDGFYESGKRYGVREICAFQDDKGQVWRFHIGIFDERQYRLMKDLLKQKIHHAA